MGGAGGDRDEPLRERTGPHAAGARWLAGNIGALADLAAGEGHADLAADLAAAQAALTEAADRLAAAAGHAARLRPPA